MLTYLFDASAAVEYYIPHNERARKAVQFIQEQRTVHRQAVLFIQNICIAEVFNTLARKRFMPGKPEESPSEESNKKHLKKFQRHDHWGEFSILTT